MGRRRGLVEDEEKQGLVRDGEDKPIPAAPISGGGGGVGAERHGVMPSCCEGDGTGDGENKPTPGHTNGGGVPSLDIGLVHRPL